MKKFFPYLFTFIILSTSSLFAEQALNSEETSDVNWSFNNGISVTWSFVNVVANPTEEEGATRYNAVLTITNNTSSDIQDWHLIVDQVDEIIGMTGALLLPDKLGYEFQYSSLSKNVIPAHGSLSIPYSAIAKESIHKPTSMNFLDPLPVFDTDPYND